MSSFVVRRRHLALAVFLAPALVVSCTGSVDPSVTGTGSTSGTGNGSVGPGPGTGGNGATGSGASGTPSGGTVGGGGSGSQPVAESAGPLVLRRLTHREYSHTLKDLLGDTSDISSTWEVDGSSNSGFEAPTSVAALNVQRYGEAADAIAEMAVAQNRVTIPCTNPATAAAERTCATEFITTFGRRAFRRPVTAVESTDMLAVFNTARTLTFDFKTSIAQVIKAMMQSPNFLYHWELGPTKPVRQGSLVTLTPHQVASRLSYLLWETMPDAMLLDAADAGQLTTADQIATQAQRLLTDKVRMANSLFNFHEQWLHYDNLDQLQKSATTYPVFTDQFRTALEPEITSFVSSVILDGDGTLKTLLSAPYAYANSATASVYGATVPGAAMTRVMVNPAQRAGILTQAAFLATNGAPSASHPVKRGLVVWRQLLCGTVPAPPANVADLPPPAPNTTTRQRYSAHSANPCATCHTKFDALGFAFENFDGVGAYRATEAGQNVDATGSAVTPGGTAFSFKNAVELTTFLSTNAEVKSCVDRQWFRYLLGRLEVPADEGSIQMAGQQADATAGHSIRDLLLSMVKSMAFRLRAPGAGETI